MGVSLSQTAQDLVRVAFLGKDFGTIMTELDQFIHDAFGDDLYNHFVADDAGQMLLETTAYALSSLAWFMDRQAGEDTLEGAEIPASVARLARLVGYRAAGAVPATGNILVTLAAVQAFPVAIPRLSQLVSQGSIVYETSQAALIPTGTAGPVTIPVVEGQTVEEIFTSNGLAGQQFFLRRVPNGTQVAQGSVEARINGILWQNQTFIDFTQTNQVEVAYAEAPPFVRTGDGIAGNIPPKGADVRIRYRATFGVNGAAPAGTITAFRQPVFANFVAMPLVVNNPVATSPGSPSEPISKTKALAPRVFQTAERAVSDPDYQALVEAFVDPDFGAVAVGRAVVARSFNEDAETRTILDLITSQAGPLSAELTTRLRTYWGTVLSATCKTNLISVQILQMDANGILVAPNIGLADALKAFLLDRKEKTADLSVVDGSVNLFRVSASVSVSVDPAFNRASVTSQVQTVVETYLTSLSFGGAVRVSTLYSQIMAISGVLYADIGIPQVLDFQDNDVTSSRVNAAGDVTVQPFEVVTLNTVTISTI